MGVVQRFEQRLGGLVEGAFARVFKGEVQPVELAGALKRAADARRTIIDADRVLTTNAYVVSLGEHDFARLDEWSGPLGRELAAMIREHAAEEHYSFVGPVAVTFVHDPALSTGAYRIAASMAAGTPDPGVTPAATLPDPGATVAAPMPAAAPALPRVLPGRPRLEYAGRIVELTGQVTTIGRDDGVDVKIDDPGVSRRHAELRTTGDEVGLVDLGSTNGTLVNGTAVATAQLRDGDRLTVGSTQLVLRIGRG